MPLLKRCGQNDAYDVSTGWLMFQHIGLHIRLSHMCPPAGRGNAPPKYPQKGGVSTIKEILMKHSPIGGV